VVVLHSTPAGGVTRWAAIWTATLWDDGPTGAVRFVVKTPDGRTQHSPLFDARNDRGERKPAGHCHGDSMDSQRTRGLK
jgi:hypothetical protein